MIDAVYEIWFTLLKMRTKTEFLTRYGSAANLYHMTKREFIKDRVPYDDIIFLLDMETREKARIIIEHCQNEKINVICMEDRQYPVLLRHIYCPPRVLYVKGRIDNDRKNIAVVGSRNPSPYGIKCTDYFVKALSLNNFTIVSGLARGIDARAHIGALEQKGTTYAVLGSGISAIYPAENIRLGMKVAENGALISEYPPETKPERWHFPERNRIISGICHATLVTEGKSGSGSLITATWSVEQGREVFCIPGNIFSTNSHGPNSLINEGARLAGSPDEIIGYVEGLSY